MPCSEQQALARFMDEYHLFPLAPSGGDGHNYQYPGNHPLVFACPAVILTRNSICHEGQPLMLEAVIGCSEENQVKVFDRVFRPYRLGFACDSLLMTTSHLGRVLFLFPFLPFRPPSQFIFKPRSLFPVPAQTPPLRNSHEKKSEATLSWLDVG